MATAKKRINVTLPRDTERAIARLAKRDQVPEATKAADLLRVALEIEEDVALDRIATKRYKTKDVMLSHDEVWK